jgi:hypothetical protein
VSPSTTNVAELLQSLAGSLPELVGPDELEIEWQRSMKDRLSGNPGTPVALRLTGPEVQLMLQTQDRHKPQAMVVREVHGVVISRQQVPVARWLDVLAGQLRALATATATDDAAVTRALSGLGVREPASDLVVDPADIAGGLRLLPTRLAGRAPEDVVESVTRICALLVETLPRAGEIGGAQEHTVRRTATDYLPRTLRSYAALPADFAATQELPGGGTALDALRAQLAQLESAATGMRNAAASDDAGQLLANGAFLADKFGVSELD